MSYFHMSFDSRTHPALVKVLQLLAIDADCVPIDDFEVEHPIAVLDHAEAALALLTDDELAAFAVYDKPARRRLVYAMKLTGICDLSRAEAVLDGFFEF
jgi:hypothetical protein